MTLCFPGRIGTSSLYKQLRMWYESVGISYPNTSANRLQTRESHDTINNTGTAKKNTCQIQVYSVTIKQSC